MEIDVEYVAKLARIKLTDEEKKRFAGELGKILDHFKELEKLDVSKVEPMTGGTDFRNIYRDDFSKGQAEIEALKKAFPEEKSGLLKVPGIFGGN